MTSTAEIREKMISSIREKLPTLESELMKKFYGRNKQIKEIVQSVISWADDLDNNPTTPHIVNLVGITGTGKTGVVNAIVEHLGLGNAYLHLEMGTNKGEEFIEQVTRTMGMVNGCPGVILYDELNRWATKDPEGNRVKPTYLPEVEELLSSGSIATGKSYRFTELVNSLKRLLCPAKRFAFFGSSAEKEDDKPEIRKINDWVTSLAKFLSGNDDLLDWSKDDTEIARDVLAALDNVSDFDFRLCLMFTCSNLDSLYGAATSANSTLGTDLLHAITAKPSNGVIKRELMRLFSPEFIGRLGVNFVLFPTIEETYYEDYIHETLIRECLVEGVGVMPTRSALAYLLDTIVFPTQGMRPTAHYLRKLKWCIVNHVKVHSYPDPQSGDGKGYPDVVATLTLDYLPGTDGGLVVQTHVTVLNPNAPHYRVNQLAFRPDEWSTFKETDHQTLLRTATHEAGHAVAYYALTGVCPLSVSIVDLTGLGNGVCYTRPINTTTANYKIPLVIGMAGIAGEMVSFSNYGDGGGADIANVQQTLHSHYTETGISGFYPARTPMFNPRDTEMKVENKVTAETRDLFRTACGVLRKHVDELRKVTGALMKKGRLNHIELQRLLTGECKEPNILLTPVNSILSNTTLLAWVSDE